MLTKWFAQKIRVFRYAPALMNIGLGVLWIWLYRAVFPYLGVIFSREEFRTNQIVLAGVLVLVIVQVKKDNPGAGFRIHLNELPHLS